MTSSVPTRWNWRGFLRRYMIILLGLLLVGLLWNPFTAPSSTDEEKQPTLKVEHQVKGRDLHLQLDVNNFQFSVEQMDREKHYGQGHVHLYINGEKVAKIFDKEYVHKNLPPGTHEVKVELAHNNHDSYGVEETFTIEVKE